MLFIEDAAVKLKAHFCRQFINRMMSLETGSKLLQETCSDNHEEPSAFQDAMPSVAFQILFLELRKVDKLAEDNVFEEDWWMELLRELIKAIFSWIVNNNKIWRNTKENSPAQLSDIISQFVVDMHFLAEILNYGGYFSKKPLVPLSLVDSAVTSAGRDPKRDINGDGWVKNAATEAIQKLLEIEKKQLFSKDDSADSREEEPRENESNDPVQDESRSTVKESLVLDDDSPKADAVEVAITT